MGCCRARRERSSSIHRFLRIFLYIVHLVDNMHPRRSFQMPKGIINRHILYTQSPQSKIYRSLKLSQPVSLSTANLSGSIPSHKPPHHDAQHEPGESGSLPASLWHPKSSSDPVYTIRISYPFDYSSVLSPLPHQHSPAHKHCIVMGIRWAREDSTTDDRQACRILLLFWNGGIWLSRRWGGSRSII